MRPDHETSPAGSSTAPEYRRQIFDLLLGAAGVDAIGHTIAGRNDKTGDAQVSGVARSAAALGRDAGTRRAAAGACIAHVRAA